MPIYDFDGAAHTEVGKLFDFDGTAKHQIGRVYDHDGTAAALLYSGETVLYDGGMAVPFEQYSSVSNASYIYTSLADNGTDLYAKVHYNLEGNDFYSGHAAWRTQQPIDLSQYSALCIRARVWNRWNSYNGVRAEFFDPNGVSLGTLNIMQDAQSSLDSEWVLDLAPLRELAEPVKIGVTAWQSYSNGRGAEFNLYKMTLV